MRGLTDQLRSWAARELKYWEQAALERIAQGGNLSPADIQTLVQYFLEDAGFVASPARPPLGLLQNVAAESEPDSYRLKRMFNLKGVNALPEGQEIRFGPQLTVIYGGNGAGKSGYARTLGSATFARGRRAVLPNATGAAPSTQPQAEIEVSSANETKVVTWREGQRFNELRAFHFFDTESLISHLAESNSLSFTPSGLWLLKRLSEVTDVVREQIRMLIGNRERPNNFANFFDGASGIKNRVLALDANSDLEEIKRLSVLTDDELKLVAALEKQIAELRLLDVSKQIERRRQETASLDNLERAIGNVQGELDDSALASVNTLIAEVRAAREAAERFGVHQFQSDSFSQVGSGSWRRFVNEAKLLAEAEANSRGRIYPFPDDICLLCRQPLSDQAREVLERLWSFASSDSQTRLNRAEDACARAGRKLREIPLTYFEADSNARRILDEELPVVVSALDAQLSAFVDRRNEMVESLTAIGFCAPAPLIGVDLTEVRALASVRRAEITSLQQSDAGHQLALAEQSLRELTHRQILHRHLAEVVKFVEDTGWAAKARRELGSTRAITAKYNEVCNELVTERYRALFDQTLKLFRDNIDVTIETRGSKGETVRQIVLNPKTFRAGFAPDQILSEGEKRAVAMADFLTEAALDERNSGIILDDPVTSFDDSWKRVLADSLAELAQKRQVVIFTHDLVFLYRISERAKELDVDIETHWIIERDGKPGFVFLNNGPHCQEDFRSSKLAGDCYAQAKNAPPTLQQQLLQQGFGYLRSSYEALIVFDIFNNVVGRFEERIRFMNLEGVHVDRKALEEVVRRMENLSRYIDAHLHSDLYAPVKPTPAVLRAEIDAFEALRKSQRDLKKAAAALSSGKTAEPSPTTGLKAEPAAQGSSSQNSTVEPSAN